MSEKKGFDFWFASDGGSERDTARALLALLDFDESVKETNLGKVLGHLQAQIAELQEAAHWHTRTEFARKEKWGPFPTNDPGRPTNKDKGE
jgi:broad specificity phosphatase PhoE